MFPGPGAAGYVRYSMTLIGSWGDCAGDGDGVASADASQQRLTVTISSKIGRKN